LTKEEKRRTGKPSIPRPEIDLIAYSPRDSRLIVMEVKSFLDSPGVRVGHLQKEFDIATGGYKLFTCRLYREIVLERLVNQLKATGMLLTDPDIQLGLAAGRIYRNQTTEMSDLFKQRNWLLWPPEVIAEKLRAIALTGYANDPFIMAAKVLRLSTP